MQLTLKRLKDQRGISLMEVVLVLIFIPAVSYLVGSLPTAISSIGKSRHVSIAKSIADKEIGYLRRLTYANLANGTTSFTDPNISLLPQGSATYQISNCPASICAAGEHAKNIQVVVSWKEGAKAQSTQVDTIIGEGGLGQ